MWDVVKKCLTGRTIAFVFFGALVSACSPRILASFITSVPTTVSGTVHIDRISNSEVSFFEIKENGALTLVGATTTNSSGEFSFELSGSVTGPVKVVASGGTYTDPATGEVVNLSRQDQLTQIVIAPEGEIQIPITPLTTMVASRVLAQLQAGVPLSEIEDLRTTAIASVAEMWGVSPSVIEAIPNRTDSPGNSSIAAAQATYVIAVFSEFAKALGIAPSKSADLLNILASDFSKDGKTDGQNGSNPLAGQIETTQNQMVTALELAQSWSSQMQAAASTVANRSSFSGFGSGIVFTSSIAPVITINAQPSNQTASGGSASFAVSASVTQSATLSYQWQKQESGSGPFSNVTGANSATLSLSGLTSASDNGDVYRVVVSATGGATSVTSSTATLTVNPCAADGWCSDESMYYVGGVSCAGITSAGDGYCSGTGNYYLAGVESTLNNSGSGTWNNQTYTAGVLKSVITINTQPSNQTASGGSASFGVSASVSNGAILSYQWQKQESGAGSFSNMSGATSATLDLSNLTSAADNGDVYRVAVSATGGADSVTSSSVSLSVSAPLVWPSITINSQPSNQTASGGSASFSVSAAVTESARLSYQWQKQESGVGVFSNVSGGTGSTLNLSGLTNTADNGDVYRVVVSASGGATSINSSSATLTVNPCNANGWCSDESIYYVGGVSCAGINSSGNGYCSGTGLYYLAGLQTDLNSSGNGTWNGKTYTAGALKSVITISVQPSNQAASGGSASFSVSASVSNGAILSYQWQKQDGGVGSFSNVSGETSATLSLSGLTFANDNGDVYRVVVSATGGAANVTSSSATLTVADEGGGPVACAGDCYLEGSSPLYAQGLELGTERQGPGDATLVLTATYLNGDGTSRFKIWKEKNGSRVLNSSGYVSNGWQKILNRRGTDFEADLTSAEIITQISGRACPTNVFLNYTEPLSESRCLYYDNGNAYPDGQALNAANFEGAIEGEDFIGSWSSPDSGEGATDSIYEGNIKTCADKGMRLPIISEIKRYDDVQGVPSMGTYTWTSSAFYGPKHAQGVIDPTQFFRWACASIGQGNCGVNIFGQSDQASAIRCVLPSHGSGTSSPTLTVPRAPFGVVGTAGNAQVSLTWSAPSSNGGSAITDYIVQYSTNGTTWSTFSDGTSTSTSATVTGLTNSTAYVFRVAAVNSAGTGSYSSASSSVTPAAPASGGGDPYFDDVTVLAHFNNNLTDSSPSPRTLTFDNLGTSSGYTTSSKFGSHAIHFSGETASGSYPIVSITNLPQYMPASNTIEMWVKPDSTWSDAGSKVLFSQTDSYGGVFNQMMLQYYNGQLQYYVAVYGMGSMWANLFASLPGGTLTNDWHHIAFVRDGGTVSIYMDGSRLGTTAAYGSLAASQLDFGSGSLASIGATPYVFGYSFSGWAGTIDDFRISNVARYTGATYPVPTAAFPDSAVGGGGSSTPVITINSQPSNQTASGGSASFSVSAAVTESATLSYQWQKQEGGIGDFFNVSGATSSTLSLSGLTNASDNGDVYRVVVSASGGATSINSSSATLTVNPCNANGWCSEESVYYVSGTACSGVDSSGRGYCAPLMIYFVGGTGTNLDSSGDGTWMAQTYVAGALKSIIAINEHPSNQTAAGGNASFSVAATVSNGATLSYQWQRQVGGNSNFSDITGETNATLSLSSLTYGNNSGDKYQVIVSATGGAESVTSFSATLTVNQCPANGWCSDESMYYMMGMTYPGLNSSGTGYSNGTYYISATAYPGFDSSGTGFYGPYYYVNASPANGYYNSTCYTNGEDSLGMMGTGYCGGNSTYYISFTPYSGLNSSGTGYYVTNQTYYINGFGYSGLDSSGTGYYNGPANQGYYISGVLYPGLDSSGSGYNSSNGLYYLLGNNTTLSMNGDGIWNDQTYTNGIPKAVITITAQPSNQTASNGSASFSVVASVSNGASLNYRWQRQDGGFGNFADVLGAANSNTLSLSSLMNSIDHGDVYQVVVSATGGADDVTSSTATLTVYDLPGVPTNVSGTAGDAQVSLTWSEPSSNGGSAITDYVVQYSMDGSWWSTVTDGNSSATTAIVTGIDNGTSYIFRVAAVNGAGTGNYSDNSSGVTPVAAGGGGSGGGGSGSNSSCSTGGDVDGVNCCGFLVGRSDLPQNYQGGPVYAAGTSCNNVVFFANDPSDPSYDMGSCYYTCGTNGGGSGGSGNGGGSGGGCGVTPVITINSHPDNQTASGGSASFSVSASVTEGATLSYQWQKQENSFGNFSDINGATNSTLSLSNLTFSEDNNDVYRCVISSTCGAESVTSYSATLTVTNDGDYGGYGGSGGYGGGGSGYTPSCSSEVNWPYYLNVTFDLAKYNQDMGRPSCSCGTAKIDYSIPNTGGSSYGNSSTFCYSDPDTGETGGISAEVVPSCTSQGYRYVVTFWTGYVPGSYGGCNVNYTSQPLAPSSGSSFPDSNGNINMTFSDTYLSVRP